MLFFCFSFCFEFKSDICLFSLKIQHGGFLVVTAVLLASKVSLLHRHSYFVGEINVFVGKLLLKATLWRIFHEKYVSRIFFRRRKRHGKNHKICVSLSHFLSMIMVELSYSWHIKSWLRDRGFQNSKNLSILDAQFSPKPRNVLVYLIALITLHCRYSNQSTRKLHLHVYTHPYTRSNT